MTTTYSPTRLSTFKDCRLKYKYQYIDWLESDIEGIETFRGKRVHETLEEFYKLVKGGSIRDLGWLIATYEDLWNRNFTPTIKIVKKELKAEDYFNKGKEALADYYGRYKPFNQAKIVSTERLVKFNINSNGQDYSFQGIMDRLDWDDKNDVFEIHDYKVTNTLMTQEEADTDWQLGLYHVALKENWPDVKKVKLVWHSLLFNKEIVSYRSEGELQKLQAAVAEKVREIESCTDFPPHKSALCDWCDFQNICPLWKHPKKMEQLDINEYRNDPGVKLVAKYAELEARKNELKEEVEDITAEQAKISEAAIEFAQKEDVKVIDGPDNQLRIEIKDEWRTPMKKDDPAGWEKLREFLKKEGKYEDVSTVNNNMVSYRIRNRVWPPDFIEKIRKFLKKQAIRTVRLIKKY